MAHQSGIASARWRPPLGEHYRRTRSADLPRESGNLLLSVLISSHLGYSGHPRKGGRLGDVLEPVGEDEGVGVAPAWGWWGWGVGSEARRRRGSERGVRRERRERREEGEA